MPDDPWFITETMWRPNYPKRYQYGAEITFGHTVADAGRKVGVIAYGKGGASLGGQFLPAAGLLYPVLLATIAQATADLVGPWTIKALIIRGGEADAIDATLAANFTATLEAIISQFRADMGQPNLEVFISRLCPAQVLTYNTTVHDQVTVYPDTHPHTHYVDTDDLTLEASASPIHFDTASLQTLGVRDATLYLANT